MEDTSFWPTKLDLVKELGISERTLERKMQRGKIRSELRNVPGRKPLSIIHPEDAAKLKRETLTAVPVEKNGATRMPPQGDMTALIEKAADAFVAALSKLPQLQVSALPIATPTKLWLSLKEAREYSGLPGDYLIEQVEAHTIAGFKRSTKGRWHIQRESLERHTAATSDNGKE